MIADDQCECGHAFFEHGTFDSPVSCDATGCPCVCFTEVTS